MGLARQILTVNGGSSSIKFALFEMADGETTPHRLLKGRLERIGHADGCMNVKGVSQADTYQSEVALPDFRTAVSVFMQWVDKNVGRGSLTAVGHRVVHGGPLYGRPQPVTPEMLAELRRLQVFDQEHLPMEVLLMEEFREGFPQAVHVACFDTDFHRDMPRIAQLLPIPRRYESQGLRRYGFHGLSFAYLMQALQESAGAVVAQGRVILAHLGNGASLAAVMGGSCMDTTMAFTPAAGMVMGTRSGDLDPGLAYYFARSQGMSAAQFQEMVNHESGLLGVSETSGDMRDLLEKEAADPRAAEAVELFCYQARKWVGAYAAVLGGVDCLVFSGGIGAHAPSVRQRICTGLGFLGIAVDAQRNQANAAVISNAGASVAVHVMETDEELVMAQMVLGVLMPERKGLHGG